jgi:hypothetical protein
MEFSGWWTESFCAYAQQCSNLSQSITYRTAITRTDRNGDRIMQELISPKRGNMENIGCAHVYTYIHLPIYGLLYIYIYLRWWTLRCRSATSSPVTGMRSTASKSRRRNTEGLQTFTEQTALISRRDRLLLALTGRRRSWRRRKWMCLWGEPGWGDDFDKINLNRELKHKITCSRKDFTK